jgi:hypothetical protein
MNIKQKSQRDTDIFNGNTPYPLLQRGGERILIPLLQRGGERILIPFLQRGGKRILIPLLQRAVRHSFSPLLARGGRGCCLINNLFTLIFSNLWYRVVNPLKPIARYSIPFTMLVILFLSAISCNNPFAPGLAEDGSEHSILGDQKTIEGVFQNFRYSYIFKDTVVYGNLLHDDFTFVYRDYDLGVDVSWGRDQDMLSTNGLFQGTQNLDLIWNDIILEIGDSTLKDISRSFNLTVMFSASDVIRVQGRASFRLRRNNTDEIWKIIQWRDESNY